MRREVLLSFIALGILLALPGCREDSLEDAGLFLYWNHREILAFKGQETSVDFRLVDSSAPIIEAVVGEMNGVSQAMARIDADGRGGRLVLTPEEDSGEVTYVLSSKLYSKSITISYQAYWISVTDVPEKFGDGSAFDFSVSVDTNIPSELLTATGDAWMEVEMAADGKTVSVHLSGNPEAEPRKGTFYVGDRERREWETVVVAQQGRRPVREDVVVFADPTFKAFCVQNYDTDGDGEICYDEALVPTEMVAEMIGIHDITGLEYFKNIRKLDMSGNDIRYADNLKELPYLYWLDLRGNPHLTHFGVTGCSVYFERCYFDITPDLHYTCWRGQLGVTQDSDHECTRSLHVRNNDVTTDWSRQDNLVLTQGHTKGDGGVAVVLTGLGYVQRDIEDGSFRRVMDDLKEDLFLAPSLKAYEEHMDIYVMEHMFENIYQYIFPYDDLSKPYTTQLREDYDTRERTGIVKTAYLKLFDSFDSNGKLYLYRADVHTNVFRYGWSGENSSWPLDYPRNTKNNGADGYTCVCYTEYSDPPEENTYRFDFRPTQEGLIISARGGGRAGYNFEIKSAVCFINSVFNEHFEFVYPD